MLTVEKAGNSLYYLYNPYVNLKLPYSKKFYESEQNLPKNRFHRGKYTNDQKANEKMIISLLIREVQVNTTKILVQTY